MRVAVLGADGFVGRAMISALSATDWIEPVAIGRRSVSTGHSGVERLRVDATDAKALASALETVDGVVNCVLGDAATIVKNAHALFGIAADRPSLRVVHTSTMSVYGSTVGDVDETTPLRGDVGSYSVAKVEAERIAQRQGGHVTMLRPGIVYGPGGPQWSTRIAEWLFSRRIGDLGAAGDGYCNLVHVDDVAAAAVLALQKPDTAGQAFNLSMVDPPTWNTYFTAFAKSLGAVPTARISRRRLMIETKLAAPPLKVLELLASRSNIPHDWLPQPIPPSLLPLWRQEIRLTMSRTEQILGLRCKPLKEGLAETAAAYLRQHPS